MSEPIAVAHIAHLLPGFVVGTLAPDERRDVLAHLTDCPTCRAELAAWSTIRDALREPPPALPADDATLREVWRRVDASPRPAVPRLPYRRLGNGHNAARIPIGPTPRRRGVLGEAVEPARAPDAQAWSVPRQETWPHRLLKSLAAAAVLVLALGFGYAVFGPGWLDLGGPVQHLAAPDSAAPGSGEVVEETLLDVIIPAAYFPKWELTYVSLSLQDIPPANTLTWTKPALRVEYVIEGGYRIRADGPSLVIRRDTAAPEDLPAGTEFVMTPGDIFIAPAGTTSDYASDASTGARILNWLLVEDPDYNTAEPVAWRDGDFDLRHNLRLQSGALTLRLLRIDLEPGAVLAAPDDPLQLIVRDDFLGSTIAMTGEDARRNIGETTATLYSSIVSPSGRGTLMP